MTEGVNDWQLAGRLFVWRYDRPSRSRRGWHFTADPACCTSIVDLLGRMKRNEMACHRTLRLSPVTDRIWSVPNFGPPKDDRFDRLRIEYSPQCEDLEIGERDEKLVLRLGDVRVDVLSAAFSDVALGLGDFGIATAKDHRSESWMFWWMPPGE